MKKKLMPVILLVIVLAGLGVGKVVIGKKPKAPEKPKVGEVMPLDEFLVNLEGDHFLRTTVALGLREGVSAETLKEEAPIIRNSIIMVLSDRRMEDLLSEKGKASLAADILVAVNKELAREKEVDEPTPLGKKGAGSDEHPKSGSKEKKEERPARVLAVYFSAFAMQ